MNKSILASSQWLDGKIQGKSVKFNQLVQNGNFTDVSVWSLSRCSYSVNSNTATIVPNAIHSSFRQAITITNNHKIFYCFDIKYTLGETYILNFFNIQTVRTGTGNWEHIETIITPTNTNGFINIYDYDNDIRSTWYLKNVMVIDLTTLFGAGNEPTTLAEFYLTDIGKLVQAGKYLPYGSGILNATAPFVFKDANDNTLATYSRTSRVDLGSLNWTLQNNSFFSYFDLIKNMSTWQTQPVNMVCTKYQTKGFNNLPDKCISYYSGYRLYIKDTDYTDAQSFKNAMSGIYLEYEPATQLELRSAGTIKDTLSNCDGKVVRNVGTRAYQSGDENNPNYLTDGTTTNYPLATPTTEQHASLAIPKLATKCTDANGMQVQVMAQLAELQE